MYIDSYIYTSVELGDVGALALGKPWQKIEVTNDLIAVMAGRQAGGWA